MNRRIAAAAAMAAVAALFAPAAGAGEDAETECGVTKVKFRLTDDLLRRVGIAWTKAESRPFTASVVLAAELTWPEDARVVVRPRVRGTLVEARKTFGDAVAKGEVLAVLDSPEVAEARGAFVGASAERRAARASLAAEREATGKGLASLERLVKEGRPMADEALARVRDLAREGLSSEKERLEVERAFLAETLGAERELALATLEARTRLVAAEAAERRAAAEFRAADARLAALGFPAEERALLAEGEPSFDGRLELRSPMAGTVLERGAVAGESVDEGSALFEVGDDSRLVALARAAERDLPHLQADQGVQLLFPAHPGRSFKGKVVHVGRALDAHTRTATLRVAVGNSRGLLRAGMLGTAAVAVRPGAEAVVVPADAIQTDGCCRIVFVRDREGVVGVRRVEPGLESDGAVEILGGIAAGEEVIGRGAFTLKAEMLKAKFGSGCCELD